MKHFFSPILLATFGLFLTACNKAEMQETPVAQSPYWINIRPTLRDPWTVGAATRAEIDNTEPIVMAYLFNEDEDCMFNRGQHLEHIEDEAYTKVLTFKEVKTPGVYSVFCVSGWFYNESLRVSLGDITLGQEITFPADATQDICVGGQEIEVVQDQYAYDVDIHLQHIKAKASFTVNNVNPEVTAMQVCLPKQGEKFTFYGKIIGDTRSQTISLTRSESANNEGLYTWSCAETIVFPNADGTTEMLVDIIATFNDDEDNVQTFHTKTSNPSTSGLRVSYTTDWKEVGYNVTPKLIFEDWTSEKTFGNITQIVEQQQ